MERDWDTERGRKKDLLKNFAIKQGYLGADNGHYQFQQKKWELQSLLYKDVGLVKSDIRPLSAAAYLKVT